jgi:hypothetical protein
MTAVPLLSGKIPASAAYFFFDSGVASGVNVAAAGDSDLNSQNIYLSIGAEF